nr:hypothetical protein GCM10020092_074950 [Actinoplanes digitatis]
MTVTVGITSYVTPVRDFRIDQELTDRCGHLTLPAAASDNGLMEGGYASATAPAVPYPAYRTDFTLTGPVRTLPVVTTMSSQRVLVGHNLVSVEILLSGFGGPPSAEVLGYRERLGEALLIAIVDGLRLDR